jgi:hypothetical protein
MHPPPPTDLAIEGFFFFSFLFFFSLAYYLFRIKTDFFLDDAVIQADTSNHPTVQFPAP